MRAAGGQRDPLADAPRAVCGVARGPGPARGRRVRGRGGWSAAGCDGERCPDPAERGLGGPPGAPRGKLEGGLMPRLCSLDSLASGDYDDPAR